MMDKATVEAAEKAFLEWQDQSARVGNMMTGYSPDRFPFHAGYYAALASCQEEIRQLRAEVMANIAEEHS